MPNKHFCQGPDCHTRTTQDRFLKSRGVVRGKYAYATIDSNNGYQHWNSDNTFVVKVANLLGYQLTWRIQNMVDRLSLSDTDEKPKDMRK